VRTAYRDLDFLRDDWRVPLEFDRAQSTYRLTEVSEVGAGGDAEEAGGGEDGAQGELLGLVFEGDAEAEVDRRRGVDHAGLLSGEERSLAWRSSPGRRLSGGGPESKQGRS
jgi:hypothetical protein